MRITIRSLTTMSSMTIQQLAADDPTADLVFSVALIALSIGVFSTFVLMSVRNALKMWRNRLTRKVAPHHVSLVCLRLLHAGWCSLCVRVGARCVCGLVLAVCAGAHVVMLVVAVCVCVCVLFHISKMYARRL
jgi:hypothetical protein